MRHAEVRYDDVKGLIAFSSGLKCIDASLSTVGRFDVMLLKFENLLEQLAQQGFIVDAKYATTGHRRHRLRIGCLLNRGRGAQGEDQPHASADAESALDLDLSVM